MNKFHFRLGLLSTAITFAALIVLPRIPINFDTKFLKLESSLGGYTFKLFGGRFSRDLRSFRKGRDFTGSMRVLLGAALADPVDSVVAALSSEAVEETIQILTDRFYLLGLRDYQVVRDPSNETGIYMYLPQIANVEKIIEPVIGTTRLIFRSLAPDREWDTDRFMDFVLDPTAWEDTGITSDDLLGVEVLSSGGTAENPTQSPRIKLVFSDEGRSKFVDVSNQNINKPLAVFVEGQDVPISVPVVTEEVTKETVGDPVITGVFNMGTARIMSMQLNTGDLPYQLTVEATTEVKPVLGPEAIKNNLIAGSLAFLLILVFMLVRYGKAALVGDICLSIFVILVLALVKFVPVAITLGSIAAIVLTYLWCVYLFLIVLEVIKQELALDKPRNLAERIAFARAWQVARAVSVLGIAASVFGYFSGGYEVQLMLVASVLGMITALITVFFVFRTLLDSLGWYKKSK